MWRNICFLLALSCILHAASISANLAYIYTSGHAGDSLHAVSYKAFLDSKGYPTTLIKKQNVVSTIFLGYRLILIGDSSGFTNNWGDSASVAALRSTNVPIVGLGLGGAAFFEKLSLAIGFMNSENELQDSVFVSKPQSQIYHGLHPVTVPSDSFLQLYARPCWCTRIYLPPPISPGVSGLANAKSGNAYYAVVQQNSRYVLWGFTDPPDSMTATGQNLFLNLVEMQLSGLLAWYPLTSNGNDTTGQQGAATLLGTPFQQGGVYCSAGSSSGRVETNNLPGFTVSAFSVEAKFMVNDSTSSGTRPVIMGGHGYRWLGIYRRNGGMITLRCNNGASQVISAVAPSLNEWHDVLASYDSASHIALLYLDGVFVCADTFHIAYGSDPNFSTWDYGVGMGFLGFMKDLRVYYSIVVPTRSVPLQISPANALSPCSPDCTFRWGSVAGATGYRLQVSTDSTFSGSFIVNSSGSADTSYRTTALAGYTRYFWRVSTAAGVWSPVWTLTTGMPLPYLVTLVSPIHKSPVNLDSITFVWNHSEPGVTSYNLRIYTDSTLSHHVLDTMIADTSITIKRPGVHGVGWWLVFAINQSGYSLGEEESFTVITTGLHIAGSLPRAFSLYQNFPNPFNPSTVIRYDLPVPAHVLLVVYNTLGQAVATLVDERQEAGRHDALFQDLRLASGMYFYKIQAGTFTQTKKFVLLR